MSFYIEQWIGENYLEQWQSLWSRSPEGAHQKWWSWGPPPWFHQCRVWWRTSQDQQPHPVNSKANINVTICQYFVFTFFSLPSLKMMALSYSGTIRMQKKMEMGKVRTMKMREKTISRIEQQSFEASSGSLGSFIRTTLKEKIKTISGSIALLLFLPRPWQTFSLNH